MTRQTENPEEIGCLVGLFETRDRASEKAKCFSCRENKTKYGFFFILATPRVHLYTAFSFSFRIGLVKDLPVAKYLPAKRKTAIDRKLTKLLDK